MKKNVTFALSTLLCLALSTVNLIAQCMSNDPTDKGVVPTFTEGNNSEGCLKFDPPQSSTLALDGFGNTITISIINGGACGQVFDWSVPDNIVVDVIIAKGGPAYNTYNYAGTGFTSDGNLHSPLVSSGKYADLSHISVCFHYKLDISKTASTSYKRTYTWDITKACLDGSELTLSDGQIFSYNFSWTASSTASDSDFKVTGTITIANNTPYATTVTSISDVLSDGTGAAISGCPTPFTLAAGASKDCSYEAFPDDADSGTNTVTVSSSNPKVEGGTADADYSFGNPSTLVDDCILVSDNCQGGSKKVCASDSPYTSHYACNIGPYSCGTDETYTNSVSFVSNTTGATGSDECSVAVHVPECGMGCTLTQGYWKTHSTKGPARPADPTWEMVGGPNTTFYLSGKSWYTVFWTPPAGNPYYILAHQFMAARLNVLNGASTTADVDACLGFAQTFFSTYTPSNKLSKEMKAKVLACASTLDDYNNGAIGPGHCSEDGTSGYNIVVSGDFPKYNVATVKNEEQLSLKPNPARTEVQIDLGSFIGQDVEITLSDRLGRVIYRQKMDRLETTVFNLQISKLSIPSGLYQVSVRTSETLVTKPLVVQSER